MTTQEAITNLKRLESAINDYCGLNDYGKTVFDMAYKALEQQKIGKWIKPTGMMPPEYHGHCECSKCGTWAGRNWLRPWKGVMLTRYCPGCGAKMDGTDDE